MAPVPMTTVCRPAVVRRARRAADPACPEVLGLGVEVDGGHHALALNPVDDAMRQNEVTLAPTVLRIPVLGRWLTPLPSWTRSSGPAPC